MAHWSFIQITNLWCCWWITFSTGNYLESSKQRVILVEKNKFWSSTRTSIKVPFVFNLHQWSASCKIFADDTSLFSKVLDVNESTKKLNFDLEKNIKWVFQWKMQFNPDPNKQTNKVIICQKVKVHSYPPFNFSNNNVKKCLIRNI